MKQIKTIVVVLALIALIFPVTIINRLVHHDELITLPEKVKWIDGATGRKIPMAEHDGRGNWRGCSQATSREYQFRTEDGLWIVCDYPEDSISLAYIDLRQKVGTVWGSPNALDPGYSDDIKGISKHSDGHIAVIFQPDFGSHALVLGVLSNKGWIQDPVILEYEDVTDVSVLRWKGDSIEIVYERAHRGKWGDRAKDTEYFSPVFMTVDNGQVKKRNVHLMDSVLCNEGNFVCHQSCNFYWNDGKWHSVYGKVEDNNTHLVIDELGNMKVVESEGMCLKNHYKKDVFDKSYLGSIQNLMVYHDFLEDKHRYVVKSLKGEFDQVEKPKLHWKVNSNSSWFRLDENSMEREYLWKVPDDRYLIYSRQYPSLEDASNWLYTMRSSNNRFLVTGIGDAQDNINDVKFASDFELVSRIDSRHCGSLVEGIPIPKKEGGFWLVTNKGCYLDFDKDLNRLNPRSVIDHLETRGSRRLDINEPQHLYKMIWVLLGLPILIFAAWLFSIACSFNLYKSILKSLIFYLATAVVCWFQVYSLLLS